MLILQQARRRFKSPPKMNTYLLGLLAAGVSIPFGFLSAHILSFKLGQQSWLAGLVLGSSLFTYTILLAQLLRRQPPRFLRRLFPRPESHSTRTLNDVTGLKLDYIGAKDPQDAVDGVVHLRSGELQRILRCSLPQRHSISAQSLVLEMLFADLCLVPNTRFQIVFPEAFRGARREMLIVASMQLGRDAQAQKDETPPLVQMQNVLDRLIERLITLGISPKVMTAVEIRQLISEELGICASKAQLNRDWRNVGNLGWEPSFRDLVLKPFDRFMQIAENRAYTFVAEQLPSNGSFEWLASALSDIPCAHISLFISPWNTNDPLSKLQLKRKLKKHALESTESAVVRPAAAQMSFFFRFEGRDAYQLESEVASARKYLASQGLNSSFFTQRQQQLQNWRSTIPCAQEQTQNRHLVAFMQSSSKL